MAGWCWSGAWTYPVGAPLAFDADSGALSFRLLRNLERDSTGAIRHEGADIGNRLSGSPVRAAAHGLVVHCGWEEGYGRHVVIAHRLAGDTLIYSVYAHLAKGIRVKSGEPVAAGQRIGSVGRSGRATSPHLHFEIRVPDELEVRWELAPVTDPLRFVGGRLPAAVRDTSRIGRVLEWAEMSDLLPPGTRADRLLDRALWWGMLLKSARHDLLRLPTDPAEVHDALVACGLLRPGAVSPMSEAPTRGEMNDDLDGLSRAGLRLPIPKDDGGMVPVPQPRSDPSVGEACWGIARLARTPRAH